MDRNGCGRRHPLHLRHHAGHGAQRLPARHPAATPRPDGQRPAHPNVWRGAGIGDRPRHCAPSADRHARRAPPGDGLHHPGERTGGPSDDLHPGHRGRRFAGPHQLPHTRPVARVLCPRSLGHRHVGPVRPSPGCLRRTLCPHLRHGRRRDAETRRCQGQPLQAGGEVHRAIPYR